MASCSWCWPLRKTTSSSRLSRDEKTKVNPCETPGYELSCKTTESEMEAEDPFSSSSDYRFRSKSASEIQRPQVKPQKPTKSGSLEDIPEHEETDVNLQQQNLYQQVISNPIISFSSESSIYKTPPTTRRSDNDMPGPVSDSQPLPCSATSPLVKELKHDPFSTACVDPFTHSVTSVSTTSLSPPQDHQIIQAIVAKMEESERDQQRQHNEMREIMTELTKKLDTLTDAILSTRSRRDSQPEEHSTDSIIHDTQGKFVDISSSVLPNNAHEIAKMLPKWKFLARLLGIQDHEIQQITENFQNDVQEQCYQMLLKWKQSHSDSDSSYHKLGEAILEEFGEQHFSKYVNIVIDTERSKLTANSQ